jgi:hypothetical protein
LVLLKSSPPYEGGVDAASADGVVLSSVSPFFPLSLFHFVTFALKTPEREKIPKLLKISTASTHPQTKHPRSLRTFTQARLLQLQELKSRAFSAQRRVL